MKFSFILKTVLCLCVSSWKVWELGFVGYAIGSSSSKTRGVFHMLLTPGISHL